MRLKIFSFSKNSIKSFITFWMIAIFFAVLVLSAILLLSSKKHMEFTNQILVHSQIVDLTYQLETTILAERREDLLWNAMQNEQHKHNKMKELKQAEKLLQNLDIKVNKMDDELRINGIEKEFRKFNHYSQLDTQISIEQMKDSADQLLGLIKNFRDKNRFKMAHIVNASNKLNHQLHKWSIGAVIIVSIFVIIGAYTLIKRIVSPTLELSKAAQKFGQGDINSRITTIKKDELGQVCQTFNEMAEGIQQKEINKRDFVASIVHDIKNPIVVIGCAANMLLDGSLKKKQTNFWLNRIVKQVQGIERLLFDLTDNIQVQSGNLSLQLKEMNFTNLVKNIQSEQNQIVTTHDIIFNGDDNCWIIGDSKRLERVTLNLLSNAIKFSPQGSKVTLTMQKNKNYTIFMVKDHGIGIDELDLKNLFKPFGRLARTQNETKGMGMGLFTVKKIIEAHGGEINIYSKVGVGTSIEVSLPIG